MKNFHCDGCNGALFFENSLCDHCETPVGYFPDRGVMRILQGEGYRRCRNFEIENVCNWMIPAEDPEPYCQSCRLTRVIPDLTQPQNHELWYRTEAAKRRLLYTLLELGLPVVGKDVDATQGLEFQFRAELPGTGCPVLTGHEDGVITVNIAEADDAERERRRTELHEPYRTLLGHFRHEIGHYYWNLLIRESEHLQEWRRVFGDERADYAAALGQYYEHGPAADWRRCFVSAYAASHPWEDWAETWAHYLHLIDCIDTAAWWRDGAHAGRRRQRQVRHAGRQLGHADLRAEQPESQHGPSRCLPLRVAAAGTGEAALRARRGDRPRR